MGKPATPATPGRPVMASKVPNVPSMCPEFHIHYSLEGDGWGMVQHHMRMWGRRFSEVEVLDEDRVVVNFYPTRDRRWAKWEAYRRAWIYKELNKIKGKA